MSDVGQHSTLHSKQDVLCITEHSSCHVGMLGSLWRWPQAVCLARLGPVQPAVGGRREGERHEGAGDGANDGIDRPVERERHRKGRHAQGCTWWEKGREKAGTGSTQVGVRVSGLQVLCCLLTLASLLCWLPTDISAAAGSLCVHCRLQHCGCPKQVPV